jgi:hypothetical protein
MPKLFLPPAGVGKRAIFWGLFLFVCIQVALSVYRNGRPELCAPDFGIRLQTLRQRLAENPGAPLVLVLGSSRAQNGLSAAYMSLSLNQGKAKPVVFNFAFAGSGSIRDLMAFRRLRAAGIKPDWLLIETWPAQWPEKGDLEERRMIVQEELFWTDLAVLGRYLPDKLDLWARALRGNLLPLVAYRSRWLHYAGAGFLLPPDVDRSFADEKTDWTPPDGTGWVPNKRLPADADALRREVAKDIRVAGPLFNPLYISPESDGALRELLAESRASGIKTALFIMPEHSECRRLYSPQTHARIYDYLTKLSKEYNLPVFDLRDWSPDEHFADFCHLAPWGVQAISEQFGRRVLQPWLNGEDLSCDVLLQNDAREKGMPR